MNEKVSYIVGSTIIFTVNVTAPHSIIPEDATLLTMDAIIKGATSLSIGSPDFTLQSTGIYTFSLDTTGMAPGLWTWRVKATSGGGNAYNEDYFILTAPVSPS